MKKPIVVIDIDDVLSLFAMGFSEYSNRTWGSSITADDYHEDWSIPWRVTREVALERALRFHEDGAVSDLKLVPQALEGLKKLKTKYDLVVVTSRRQSIKTHTIEWLDKNFPGVFKDVIFAGIWDKHGLKDIDELLTYTKTDICIKIGARYLVDDQLKHCLSAADRGVKAILFGDYTWNKTNTPLPRGMVRKKTWPEVVEYLNAQ